MGTRSRAFSKLAKDVDASGNIVATGISSDVTLGGATIYSTRANLPASGNTAGDQAYVTENNRLYIWNGAGWYNIALLNLAPSIQSVTDSDGGITPFSLSSEGAVTTITITAADSDGDPITYTAEADSAFSGLATISQADNVFTITPFSEDSATTESGTITFKADDGVNIASSGVQTFTLVFTQGIVDITSVTTTAMTNITQSSIRAAFVYGNYLWIGKSTSLPVFDIASNPLNPTFVSDDALDTNIGGAWNDTTEYTGHVLDRTNGVLWNSRSGYPIRSITLNGDDGTYSVNSGFIPSSNNNGNSLNISSDGSTLFSGYRNVSSVSGLRSYSVGDYSSAPTLIDDVNFTSTYRYCDFNSTSINLDNSRIYVINEYKFNGSGTNLRPSSSSTGTGRLHIVSVNPNGTFGSVVTHQLEASAQAYGTYGVDGTVAYDINASYDYVYSSPQEVDTLFIMRVSKTNPSSITRYTYSFGSMGDTGFMHYQEGILYINSDSGLIMLDVKTPGGIPTAHYLSGGVGSNWQYTKNETLKNGKYYAVAYTGSNSKVIY
jgi:hypothetical protein